MKDWGLLQWTLASLLVLVAIIGSLYVSGVLRAPAISVRVHFPPPEAAR